MTPVDIRFANLRHLEEVLERDFLSSISEYRREQYLTLPPELKKKCIQGELDLGVALLRAQGCTCSEWQIENRGCDCAVSRREPK